MARHLRGVGARAVVVTLGGDGALVSAGSPAAAEPDHMPAPAVDMVDTTGAGDAAMAALLHGLVTDGWPPDAATWRSLVGFATAVAALTCEARGGATAIPTMAAVRARFG